ncbi:MAG TPA: prepilin-type N-terminal cleavage/methylation domain-containing protein [Patescibacteria group bacterium]|nr:prepilin-type N-terminal cleavage/methylation domain-containing protein [Patescibacteria group bacterium]
MRKRSQLGFSLLEVIIVIAIVSLLVSGLTALVIYSFRYNAVIWEQLKTQNEGRQALQKVVDIVRRAESSNIGSFALESASSTTLVLYANVDGDAYRERVRFYLAGTDFKMGVIKPSGTPLAYEGEETEKILASDVVNLTKDEPVFLYYDEDYTGSEGALIEPIEAANVRSVRLHLELEKDPTETPVPLQVETLVQIRNLKQT